MAKTVGEMATKGKENYARKKSTMVARYKAADLASAFDRTPFGPMTKKAYRDAVGTMKAHYTESALDEDKWARKWADKVSK
ncbi:MAG: hypothetical protein U9R75_09615 [Candidatus Thermoplasmatota archaeon]|nr:hypothetical protein [Candidatus Thermoplasmatota archaeon]